MKIRSITLALLFLALAAGWLATRHTARVALLRTGANHALAVAVGGNGLSILQGETRFDGVVDQTGELYSFGVVAFQSDQFNDISSAFLDSASGRLGLGGVYVATGPAPNADFPGMRHYRLLRLPLWLLLLLTGFPAALALRRAIIRRRRKRAGLCLACGYDLCESLGRCPECGASRSAAEKTHFCHR